MSWLDYSGLVAIGLASGPLVLCVSVGFAFLVNQQLIERIKPTKPKMRPDGGPGMAGFLLMVFSIVSFIQGILFAALLVNDYVTNSSLGVPGGFSPMVTTHLEVNCSSAFAVDTVLAFLLFRIL